MFQTTIDPDLLIYQEQQWRSDNVQCLLRLQALTNHRRFIAANGLQILISNEIAHFVYCTFPWNNDFGIVAELQDLKVFLYNDLASAKFIDARVQANTINLDPPDLTCVDTGITEIAAAWRKMLCVCVEVEEESEMEFVIATWNRPHKNQDRSSLTILIDKRCGVSEHLIPLAKSEENWVSRVDCLEYWPDIERCVQHYFAVNYENLNRYRGDFSGLGWTDKFMESVMRHCENYLRIKLIRAITKKFYGITDGSLRDEVFKSHRRFRVDYSWRVHYRQIGDRIILDEFGSHDMGIK